MQKPIFSSGSQKKTLTGVVKMTDQLSFLSQLYDTVQKGFACQGWDEATTNDCGVYVHGTHHIVSGKYNKYPYIEVDIARVGDEVLYEFGYELGADSNYCGRFSPLSKPCYSCHRNNSAEFVASAIVETFVNSVVPRNRNITQKSRTELVKTIKKMEKQISEELK